MINSRLIEITGPTGVGKSTISDFLGKGHTKLRKWILSEDLTKIIKPNGLLFPHLDITAGLRFHKSYPEYKQLFKKLHASNLKSDSIYIRNKRAVQHYKVLCDVQMAEEFFNLDKNTYAACVFQEGLVFKSFSRIDIRNFDGELHSFLKSFPLPAAIVHLDAKAEEIAKRAFNRKKTAPIHKNKSFSQIVEDIRLQKDRADKLNAFLAELGVHVQTVNAEAEPELTANKLTEILDTLVADS